MYASDNEQVEVKEEEELNLFEASGIRKKAFWQCIRYIAPDASNRKWKAGDAIGVYCTVCKVRINYDSVKNPKAVQRHMCKYHKKLLDEYDFNSFAKRKRKKSESSVISYSPRRIRSRLYSSEENEQVKFTRLVARWTALSMRSVGILEDPLLQEMISFANATKEVVYLPNIQTTKSTIMMEYENLRAKVLQKITTSCNFFSLTTHLWSSRSMKAFMTFTLHFLAEDFTLKSFTLDVKPVVRKQLRDMIQREMFQIFSQWNLSEQLLTMVLRDHCPDMVDACEDWGISHFPVIDDSLHLIFGPFLQEPKRRRELPDGDEFLWEDDDNDSIIIDGEWLDHDSGLDEGGKVSRIRQIVHDLSRLWFFLRTSTVANDKLELLQRQLSSSTEATTTDTDARTSTLGMISKIVQSMTPINDFLEFYNSPDGKKEFKGSYVLLKQISDEEWAILKGILYLLGPFGKATAALQEEKYSTFVSVLPVLRRVKDFISDPSLFDFKKSTLTKTKKRYFASYGDLPFFDEVVQMLETCRELLMDKFDKIFSQLNGSILWTTLLDPRLGWKSGHWKAESEKEVAKKLLLDEVEKLALPEFQLPVPQSSSFVVESSCLSEDEDFDLDFNKTTVETCSLTDLFESEKSKLKASLMQEVEAYLLEDSEDNPLKWWQLHRFKYPNVARVARKWLTVTSSSTSSDRIFSTCGFMETCKSSDLLDEYVRAQVFVHNNYNEIE